MADLLGFAWKVLVIGLIVAAAIAAILAGDTISTMMQDMAGDRDANAVMVGDSYGPMMLAKPLLAGLDGHGTESESVWGLLTGLALAIPIFALAVLALRWLIAAAK